ncbi:MAG: transporter [Hyphomicrobiales bacterium]|nr:MAG: transporter [Hyphomicrobiales bacterium]
MNNPAQSSNNDRLAATRPARLSGLDVARLIAFVGMVIVNFKVVMVSDIAPSGQVPSGWLGALTGGLEGRAAATFVVLAGIGLGLSVSGAGQLQTLIVTLKRAAFLLVIGLLNVLIFSADILHYYAFYFLFGAMLLPLSTRVLVAIIVAVNVVFVGLLLTLNYDLGWNWATYEYLDFWSVDGFTRNLFFNGWHPVFPWLSFLLVGIILSRFELSRRRIQMRMVWLGAGGLLIVELISRGVISLVPIADKEWVAILGTSPVPPMPFYILAGICVAMFVTGLCLLANNRLERAGVLKFIIPAGRQTLTLYMAHIFIGMGLLDVVNMLGGQSLETAVLAALMFCAAAIVYASFWSRWFKRGPLEFLMRRIVG